ncbi:MAG: antibiotic biosynthesis monooxygenase [Chroococcidiopsidaceae cyanobacterium CP_BM_ER_R8_30]|nr:antibiotic biosynthesis monooxygenase [Chroococcidiopsidaceae cyanobacterium CP_BM_ER_R8_30]
MTAFINNERMTTISKNLDIVTLINVFTVEPENQQRLTELWVSITEDVMCKQLGFISANFHKSLDGKHGANYAQWSSVESIESMLKSVKINERYQYLHAEVLKIAKMSPVLYEVCYTKTL